MKFNLQQIGKGHPQVPFVSKTAYRLSRNFFTSLPLCLS